MWCNFSGRSRLYAWQGAKDTLWVVEADTGNAWQSVEIRFRGGVGAPSRAMRNHLYLSLQSRYMKSLELQVILQKITVGKRRMLQYIHAHKYSISQEGEKSVVHGL